MEKIGAIRIRSIVRANAGVKAAVYALNLRKQNSCVILDKNPSVSGLLRKAESVITYGELSKEVVSKLISKSAKRRGIKVENVDAFTDSFFDGKAKLSDIGLKNLFRLHPPRGGFERKGKKKPFSVGGSVGYRRSAINDLLSRMM
ncbi:MAG: uL30 family ribosomal protein [Candidatus Parvarchaeota archaeon]|nr:uL30 family ribosomal protein [Candidatus Parvarchaeota archaeon]MCW1301994.1 uL30 family ribosomal protein [Candidatus Parvarchaeota archaeon]